MFSNSNMCPWTVSEFPRNEKSKHKKSTIDFFWSFFKNNVCVCDVSKDADTSLIFSFEFFPSLETINVFLPSQASG